MLLSYHLLQGDPEGVAAADRAGLPVGHAPAAATRVPSRIPASPAARARRARQAHRAHTQLTRRDIVTV